MGHALVALTVPTADPVHRVSIIPRGAAALGMTMQRPLEDRYLLTEPELADRLAILLGGRSAEEIAFKQISTGAADDLKRATDIARAMVVEYGMSDRIGPQAYGRDGFKVCKTIGVPPEQDWPYDIAKFSDEPPAARWSSPATKKNRSWA